MASLNWMLNRWWARIRSHTELAVGQGRWWRSAARSLHVAGQSRRHEEHLGENDHVADVDDQLRICIGCKGSPGSDGGQGRVPR